MRAAVFVLCLGLVSCSKGPNLASESVPNEQPASTGGNTDPAYDWEKSSGLNLSRNYAPSTIQSSKSLDQTIAWLRWAMLRYGRTQPTNYIDKVSDIRVSGCTMEWTETQAAPNGDGVTTVARYTVPLAEADLDGSVPLITSEFTRFTVKNEAIRSSTVYYEHGKDKGEPRLEKAWSVQIPLRDEDHIAARVAFALVHAAELCGAKATPRR